MIWQKDSPMKTDYHSLNTRPFGTNQGMSLVEILVSTMILSLLAALLFPAYKSVKEKTRQVVCMNNLRNIGIALVQYSNENNGFLPPARTDDVGGSGSHHIQWPDLLLIQLTNGKEKFFGSPQGKYRWRNNPFDCPSIILPQTAYGIGTSYQPTIGGFTPRYATYGMDAATIPKSTGNLTGRTALLFDASVGTGGTVYSLKGVTTTAEGGSYWYGNMWSSETPRHTGGVLWLFWDGSVRWKPWAPTNTAGADAEFNPNWEEQK
jgi:prepilin-type N-terminal cleavage/methylation domain-containing protein